MWDGSCVTQLSLALGLRSHERVEARCSLVFLFFLLVVLLFEVESVTLVTLGNVHELLKFLRRLNLL